MKISRHFIHIFPLKKPLFSPVWHGPPLVVLLLSILAPKWAALTLTLCTQHCVPASHVRVPHRNSISTCFCTVFQVAFDAFTYGKDCTGRHVLYDGDLLGHRLGGSALKDYLNKINSALFR